MGAEHEGPPRPPPALAPLVVLAAGSSSRMGRPKGLLPYRGRPWIDEQLARYAAAGGREATVVVGVHRADYEKVLNGAGALAGTADLTVTLVENPHPETGPFGSLRRGLAARGAADTFVLPVDVAAPAPGVWRALTMAIQAAAGPTWHGRGGHPVLLSAKVVQHLLALDEGDPSARLDVQLRGLGSAFVQVPVEDEAVVTNLNDPEAWARFTA